MLGDDAKMAYGDPLIHPYDLSEQIVVFHPCEPTFSSQEYGKTEFNFSDMFVRFGNRAYEATRRTFMRRVSVGHLDC